MRSCGREAEGGGLLNRYTALKPYRGFESLRLRHLDRVVISAWPFDASKNANTRAGFPPKLRTDQPEPVAKSLSLRPLFSKAPDCGKQYGIRSYWFCATLWPEKSGLLEIHLG